MDLSTLSKEDIIASITPIEGWFGQQETELFYDIISNLKNKASIVEIGSWCGRSISLITLTARKFGNTNKIFSIDPFLTSKDDDNQKYPIFKKNLEERNIWDEITHIKEKSQIVGTNFAHKIEFIFIDGFHKYDSVKKDFELFSKSVIENGYIAFHDVGTYYGPTKLVQDILQSQTLKVVDFKDSTFLLQNSKPTDKDKEKNLKFLDQINSILKTKNLTI